MFGIGQRRFSAAFSILFVLSALLGSAQENGSSREGRDYWFIDPEDLSAELLVLTGANDIKAHQQADGSTWVSFFLKAEYPATDSLILIDLHLRDLGFEPLRNDWLNPEIPSSYTRGWSDFEDATSDPPQYVHQWLTQWKNEQGVIVMVDMRYRSPMTNDESEVQNPASDDVQVTQALLPRELAERMFRLVGGNRE